MESPSLYIPRCKRSSHRIRRGESPLQQVFRYALVSSWRVAARLTLPSVGLYQSRLINLDAELAKLDDRASCAHAVPLSTAFHNVAAFIGRKPMLRGL